jgi:hypothetical protein
MPFALDREALVNVATIFQLIHKRYPNFFALAAVHEGIRIPYQDQGVSSA